MVRSILIASILLQAWLPAHADITQYRGADGRLYYSNLPPPARRTWQEVGRERWRTSRQATVHLPTMQIVQELARQHDIEPRLVQAIITVESNFNPHAVSRAGAQGLMQLMPGTAARYHVANPFDPRANIDGGMRYLKDLLQLFPGDLRRVLAAYNAGEQSVLQYNGIPPYPETQQYVERVLTLYGKASAPAPAQKIYRYRLVDGSILLTDTPR
jgi:soluble lytic murein transglycosylase-like protein